MYTLLQITFETSDTGVMEALCDINTEGKMMSDRNTRNGSGEKSRLTPSIVINLLIKDHNFG